MCLFMYVWLCWDAHSDVQKGMRYEYRIQVEAEGLRSELSPTLVYTHGDPFCGDGQLQGYIDTEKHILSFWRILIWFVKPHIMHIA